MQKGKTKQMRSVSVANVINLRYLWVDLIILQTQVFLRLRYRRRALTPSAAGSIFFRRVFLPLNFPSVAIHPSDEGSVLVCQRFESLLCCSCKSPFSPCMCVGALNVFALKIEESTAEWICWAMEKGRVFPWLVFQMEIGRVSFGGFIHDTITDSRE